MRKLTSTRIKEEPVSFFQTVSNLFQLLEVNLLVLIAAHGSSGKLYPLEIHFHTVFSFKHWRWPSCLPLASTAAAPPPSPVLLIDGRRFAEVSLLCGIQVIGLWMVTHHTFWSSWPVLISASCTCPVRLVGVESVSVIVLLTGIDRWVKSGTAACIGAWSLWRLCGAGGPWALTQTLRTADGPGPVKVGAYLTGPLISNFSHVGGPDSRSCTGVGADKETTTTLGSGRAPVQTRIQVRAVLERFLCDDGSYWSLCSAHSALDSRWPVFIGAVVTDPLYPWFCHTGSLWTV